MHTEIEKSGALDRGRFLKLHNLVKKPHVLSLVLHQRNEGIEADILKIPAKV